MKAFTVLIPARGGSKSIPKKNIKELGGKPLIAWTIEFAKQAGFIPYVSTDDDEIKKIAIKYGAIILNRPLQLAQDDTSMAAVLKYHCRLIDTPYIILMQPTSQFREMKDLKNCMRKMRMGIYDSVISMNQVPARWSPHKMMEWNVMRNTLRMVDGRSVNQRITRRQDYPPAYMPSGEFYIFKKEYIEKFYPEIYGNKIDYVKTKETINIDDQTDFNKAEEQLKKI